MRFSFRSFSALAISCAVGFCFQIEANAQQLPDVKLFQTPTSTVIEPRHNIQFNDNLQATVSKTTTAKLPNNLPLAATYRVIDRLVNAYSYMGETTPFVYDSEAGIYCKIQRGDTPATLGHLFISTSSDAGYTWSDPYMVYDADLNGEQCRYPSIQIYNPEKSTKPEELDYVYIAPVLRRASGKPDAAFDGAVIGFNYSGSKDAFHYPGPEENNNDNQRWSTGNYLVTDKSQDMTYLATRLSNRGADTSRRYGQYGQYGYMNFNPAGDVFSYMPPQWDKSKFPVGDEPNIDRSFSGELKAGTDNQGGVYAGVINFFDPTRAIADQRRLPAVSKSTDKGKNWTDFEIMPESVWENYCVSQNATVEASGMFGQLPYQTQGFIVTGVDRWHFAYAVGLRANTADPVMYQFVEAYKENGAWGMRKIADYSGSTPLFIRDSSGFDVSVASFIDNEVQIISTSDGQNLLFKWLDFRTYTVEGQDLQISDIFYCVRPIGQNQWGLAYNITEDAVNNKLSWLPQTVASLDNIPLLLVQTETSIDPSTLAYLTEQRKVDLPQQVVMTNFSAKYVSVQEKTTNPVHNVVLYPNPALDRIEIGFALDAPSKVRVFLTNTLGQEIAEFYSGELLDGVRAISSSLESIPSGAYLVNIAVNGRTTSAPLSVIH